MKSVESSSSPSRWPVWLGCLIWGAVVSLGWLLCFRFPTFWLLAGIGEPSRPFLDLFGLLASCDAARQGLDPYLPNSLDPYHRPFVYSNWWLTLASLGLGRKDTLWLGAALAGALLATALAWLRPRSWREGGLVLLFLFSPACLLAVHRANNDLVILVVVSAGLLCFRRDGWAWRAAGMVLFAVAAVLKYYPLVTLVLILELRTWRRMLAGAALYVGVLLVAWPGLVPGLQSASRNAPA
ncbi:MAG: glycosyltransferase 87 family protein, partial [Opitutus sp.]